MEKLLRSYMNRKMLLIHLFYYFWGHPHFYINALRGSCWISAFPQSVWVHTELSGSCQSGLQMWYYLVANITSTSSTFLPCGESVQHTENFPPATDISVPVSECLLRNKKARICKRTGWKTGPSKEEDGTSEAVCVQGCLHVSSLLRVPVQLFQIPNHSTPLPEEMGSQWISEKNPFHWLLPSFNATWCHEKLHFHFQFRSTGQQCHRAMQTR